VFAMAGTVVLAAVGGGVMHLLGIFGPNQSAGAGGLVAASRDCAMRAYLGSDCISVALTSAWGPRSAAGIACDRRAGRLSPRATRAARRVAPEPCKIRVAGGAGRRVWKSGHTVL